MPPLRYLVGSPALAILARISHGSRKGAKATWHNTDTRTNPLDYYKMGHNQEIAIRAMGRFGACIGFMGYVGEVSDLKKDECMKDAILQIKSIMRERGGRRFRQFGEYFRRLSDRIETIFIFCTSSDRMANWKWGVGNDLGDFANVPKENER